MVTSTSRRLIFSAFALQAALTCACQKTKTLNLPEAPRVPSVVFAALFGEDGPSEVGPVVMSTALYAGRYSVESDDSKLEARLFFFEIEALVTSARAACEQVPNRLERTACLDRVADCTREPTSCLAALPEATGCEDRLPIALPEGTRAFRRGDGGELAPASEVSAALAGLTLCGPSLAKRCPILLPGYVVTEADELRCLAPSTQRACALEVDLSRCGLGTARGEIPESGAFVPAVDLAGCVAETARPSDVFEGAERTFAVVCGARRFTASLLEAPFGEVRCTRKGPTVYNDGTFTLPSESWETRGAVRAMKWTRFPGWTPRLVFDGTGLDGCACVDGVSTLGCAARCDNECNELVSLPECGSANLPHPCRAIDAAEDCRARCRATCDSGLTGAACVRAFSGHQLQLATESEPERGLGGVHLGDARPVTRLGSLAVLESSGARVVALGLERELRFFTTAMADTLVEATDARTPTTPLEVAGLAAVPARPDVVVAFGRTNAAPVSGSIAVFRIRGNPLVADSLRTVSLPLPSVDAAVLAGSSRDRVVAVALTPPAGETSPDLRTVAVIGLEAGNAELIPVDGRPTAIGAGPAGEVWVGLLRDDGAPGVAILEPRGGSLAVTQTLELPKGLVPVAFFADPRACATGTCRTYVGLEQTSADPDQTPALVAALDYAPTALGNTRLTRAFIATGSSELSFFEHDPEADVLYAVAARSNRLTPIALIR